MELLPSVHLLEDNETWFPCLTLSGTKTLFKRSKNVLSVAHALLFRFIRYLSVTRTVMSVN